MTHLWIRAEERPNEKRVGVTPNGVKSLLQAGFDVTIERDSTRAISIESYSGAQVAGTGDWRSAPKEAIIIGLKELPEEITPLHHRHIMFGHAFKDQPDGQKLLERFQAGGGTLYDLEPQHKRVISVSHYKLLLRQKISTPMWHQILERKILAS